MIRKPLGSDLYIIDGEWVVPFGLLFVAMLFGDITWVKSIMFVMLAIIAFHTAHEHKKILGNKDLLMKEGVSFAVFIGSCFIVFIMPVYATICYATYISHLKKKKKDNILADKIKTYNRMVVIMVLAILVQIILMFSLSDEINAASQQGSNPTINVPGTMKQ
jgi:ABC-type amino acid transport system permease subunit